MKNERQRQESRKSVKFRKRKTEIEKSADATLVVNVTRETGDGKKFKKK